MADNDDMSPQVEFLKNVIQSAQSGNEGAVILLRQLCIAAAEKAPLPDLITLGQCFYRIANEASRTELGRN